MPFTSQLGSKNSQLGNIQLGITPTTGNIYSESLTFSVTASITEVSLLSGGTNINPEGVSSFGLDAGGSTYNVTLILSATAATVLGPNNNIQLAVEIDGIGSVSTRGGTVFDNTLTIAGIDAFTAIGGIVTNNTVTIAATDSATTDFVYIPGTSLDVDASVTVDPGLVINAVLTIAGIAFCDRAPENIIESVAIASAGAATITQFTVSYEGLLEIDGIADFDFLVVGKINLSITVSATDSLTSAVEVDFNPAVVITAQDAITNATIQNAFLTLPINVTSYLFVEGYYNNLEIVSVDSTIEATTESSVQTENPAGIGSLLATATVTHNQIVSQTIVYGQSVTQVKDNNNPDQTITFTQTATSSVIRVHNVSQTLTFTQLASAIRDLKSHLIMSQAVSYKVTHNVSVTQTILFNQNTTKQGTMSRSASNTLVFNPPTTQSVPITTQRFPGGPGQGLTIPKSTVTVTVQNDLNRRVILSVAGDVIVLPTPQLGDTESYSGTMTLKRTQNGDTYTYIKRSPLKSLKYTFFLDRDKSLELRRFLILHNSELINMINWKGEVWLVNLTNNPFDLTANARYQPKGERVDVELDFQGIKTAG